MQSEQIKLICSSTNEDVWQYFYYRHHLFGLSVWIFYNKIQSALCQAVILATHLKVFYNYLPWDEESQIDKNQPHP